MSEELLEEVDKNDKPTGRKITKKKAHDNLLIHRVAAVFVFDGDDRLYVQEHLKHDRMLDHTVGGHVAAGETYYEAAVREMEEEIGLTGVSLQEIATSYYSRERRYIHMFGIYECYAPQDWHFIPNEEVDTIYPMKVKDIVDSMNASPETFTMGFINTMRKFIEVKSLPYKLEDQP